MSSSQNTSPKAPAPNINSIEMQYKGWKREWHSACTPPAINYPIPIIDIVIDLNSMYLRPNVNGWVHRNSWTWTTHTRTYHYVSFKASWNIYCHCIRKLIKNENNTRSDRKSKLWSHKKLVQFVSNSCLTIYFTSPIYYVNQKQCISRKPLALRSPSTARFHMHSHLIYSTAEKWLDQGNAKSPKNSPKPAGKKVLAAVPRKKGNSSAWSQYLYASKNWLIQSVSVVANGSHPMY